MNNIKTLARQYWDGLDTAQQKELFNANLSSGMESVYDTVCTTIENIFYSEVIIKWWHRFEDFEKEKIANKWGYDISTVGSIAVKELYLKEQPLKGDESIFTGLDELCEKANLPKFGTVEFNDMCAEFFGGVKKQKLQSSPDAQLFSYSFLDESGTEISFKAYNYHEAISKLESICINPKDFQTK